MVSLLELIADKWVATKIRRKEDKHMNYKINGQEEIDLAKKNLFKIIDHIGFVKALTLIFITLKLCKVIDWSWLLVLAPMWVNAAIWSVFTMTAAFVMYCIERNEEK